MLEESTNSIIIDIMAHYKGLQTTNKHNSSVDYLVSEWALILVDKNLILFSEELMKNPSLKSVKDLLKISLHHKVFEWGMKGRSF